MHITQYKQPLGLVILCLSGFLVLYAGSYVAYRQFGPASYYWPRNTTYPLVLCRTESRSDILMYRVFRPCIAAEDAYYRHKHRNVKLTLDDWAAMDYRTQESE